MSNDPNRNEGEAQGPWKKTTLPLKDVVLSNSWALQAILQYLEETQPGAKDRIWRMYLAMKEEAERMGAGGEGGGEDKSDDSSDDFSQN